MFNFSKMLIKTVDCAGMVQIHLAECVDGQWACTQYANLGYGFTPPRLWKALYRTLPNVRLDTIDTPYCPDHTSWDYEMIARAVALRMLRGPYTSFRVSVINTDAEDIEAIVSGKKPVLLLTDLHGAQDGPLARAEEPEIFKEFTALASTDLHGNPTKDWHLFCKACGWTGERNTASASTCGCGAHLYRKDVAGGSLKDPVPGESRQPTPEQSEAAKYFAEEFGGLLKRRAASEGVMRKIMPPTLVTVDDVVVGENTVSKPGCLSATRDQECAYIVFHCKCGHDTAVAIGAFFSQFPLCPTCGSPPMAWKGMFVKREFTAKELDTIVAALERYQEIHQFVNSGELEDVDTLLDNALKLTELASSQKEGADACQENSR